MSDGKPAIPQEPDLIWSLKVKKRSIVLFSGGIDSSVVAKQSLQNDEEVIGLTVFCRAGNANHDEAAAADAIAGILGIEHRVLDMSGLGVLFQTKATIFAVGGQINNCHHDGGDHDHIHNRAFSLGVEMMHMAAMACAVENNIDTIKWGVHADDVSSEERPKMETYLRDMSDLVFSRTGKRVSIETPLIDMTKAEVIELGRSIGVPINITMSCCQPQDGHPCGICKQCRLRDEAMTAASALTA